MLVITWLLFPLIGLFPLVLGWNGSRRKALAVTLTVIPVLFLLLLTIAESFTGYLVGGMIGNPDGVPRGRFLRFLALHSLGFPILMVLSIAFLSWVQLRVAKRAERRPGQVIESAQPRV
jgi:hypothetical protein